MTKTAGRHLSVLGTIARLHLEDTDHSQKLGITSAAFLELPKSARLLDAEEHLLTQL